MAKVQYHYGRVSTVNKGKVSKTGKSIESLRVGPVYEDLSGKTYRSARKATLSHLLTMLRRIKSKDVTLTAFGRLYSGDNNFKWVGAVFDRESLIDQIVSMEKAGETPEYTAEVLFDLKNGEPPLVLAWEAKPHVYQPREP